MWGACRSRRLTGGPEVAPRVHSDLAGQAAGVWEIPAEPGGTGSEHSEEQEAADPPSALRPQGHGCGRARLCHRCTSLRRPPCLLLNPRPGGGACPRSPPRPAPPPSQNPPSASALLLFLSTGVFVRGTHNLQARTPAHRGHRIRGAFWPEPTTFRLRTWPSPPPFPLPPLWANTGLLCL